MIPGSVRSPEERSGNPLQYSCLENPMDRGDWRATVDGSHKELDTTERLSREILEPECWRRLGAHSQKDTEVKGSTCL